MPVVIKPGSCFKKHSSADVVTICMLLTRLAMSTITLCVRGSIPLPVNVGITQLVE